MASLWSCSKRFIERSDKAFNKSQITYNPWVKSDADSQSFRNKFKKVKNPKLEYVFRVIYAGLSEPKRLGPSTTGPGLIFFLKRLES